MSGTKHTLLVLAGRYGICRLGPDEPVPAWGLQGEFFSVTRTDGELSIVCAEADVPASVLCERGWRLFKIDAVTTANPAEVLATVCQAGKAEDGVSVAAGSHVSFSEGL